MGIGYPELESPGNRNNCNVPLGHHTTQKARSTVHSSGMVLRTFDLVNAPQLGIALALGKFQAALLRSGSRSRNGHRCATASQHH